MLFYKKTFNALSSEGTTLFIDIGTNGEIVLLKNGSITASSTAAGPALEAGQISCGMCAEDGAVYRISPDGKALIFGNAEPLGLCGSGIIDAIANSISNGEIDSTGRIASGAEKLKIVGRVFLTQKDIREIQLAKAAVSAGIKCLLNETDTSLEDITRVVLAGGFGESLSIKNACIIGLIPAVLENKTVIVGNAAGEGAVKMLLDDEQRHCAAELALECKYLELADITGFVEVFVNSMGFDEAKIQNA